MQPANTRFIPNPYLHNWSTVNPTLHQICGLFINRLARFTHDVAVPTSSAISSDPKETFQSFDMFQGAGSYLYLYIKLIKFFKVATPEILDTLKKSSELSDEIFYKLSDPNYYFQAATAQYHELIKLIQGHKGKPQISFCFSKYSIFLCGAHLSYLKKDPKEFRKNVQLLLGGCQYIMKNHADMLAELLYGIPGYLIMLLELYNEYKVIGLENDEYHVDVVKQVSKLVDLTIAKGVSAYQKVYKQKVKLDGDLPKNFHLTFEFYSKQYLGGAHGLGGTLNVLLLSYQLFSTSGFSKDLNRLLKLVCTKSVQFLLTQRVNNNFSSSVKKELTENKLIQFCHGNPGIITPLLHYCQLFPESAKALNLQEIIVAHMNKIWEQGILKKGYWGLCHGTSGNAYTFISPVFHRVAPILNEEFRRKAQLFWILQQNENVKSQINQFEFDDRIVQGISDFPLSLMSGTAGDLCFAADLILGEGSFPGYDL